MSTSGGSFGGDGGGGVVGDGGGEGRGDGGGGDGGGGVGGSGGEAMAEPYIWTRAKLRVRDEPGRRMVTCVPSASGPHRMAKGSSLCGALCRPGRPQRVPLTPPSA